MLAKNIVLLHGWGAGVEKLRPLVDGLKKKGWSVFVPKLPGFDLKAPKEVWQLKHYSDYVLKQSKSKFKSKKYFVFGHSFGGRLAIKAANEYPEKLSGIILCASGGISRGSFLKRVIFYVLAKAGKVFLIIPPGARLWRKLLYKLAREHDYEKAQGIMRDIFRKVISEDLRQQVSLIKVPTLVLWGEKDKTTPFNDALFIKNKLSQARLISFKNKGHTLAYKKYKKIAQEIEKWYQSLN